MRVLWCLCTALLLYNDVAVEISDFGSMPSFQNERDTQWRRNEWMSRHRMWLSGEPLNVSEGKGRCTHPQMTKYIDIPVLYINLESRPIRKANMERYYGCLNLIRVPAVLGADPNIADHFLSHSLDKVPGLVDKFEGDPDVDDDQQRPQSQRSRTMFLGALGCFISHVKAAYMMLSMNVNAVLVLEDDITPELVPYWMEPGLSVLSTAQNISAYQLSIQSSEVVWDHLKELSILSGPTLLGSAGNTGSMTWLASNGAYVLTRMGASMIMKTLLNPQTLRLDLSKLTCINIDICLMPFLINKAIVVPPLFVHMGDGVVDAESGVTTTSSIISTSDFAADQAEQLVMRQRSRENAIQMAMGVYIRRPGLRLAYRYADDDNV